MKSVSARCGQVTRRLKRNEPLKGTSLRFALDVIPGQMKTMDDELFSSMAQKLIAGQPLSAYELHILVDVLFLHLKLSDPRKAAWRTTPMNSEAAPAILDAMHAHFSRHKIRPANRGQPKATTLPE